MEFKGSKGQWKVEFNYRKNTTALEVNTYSEIGGKTNLHQYILDSEDQCSAETCSCISKEMANAKLIASAPELLEALIELVELKQLKFNDGEYPSDEYLKRKPIAWDNAKKVIEKALT